LYPVAVGVSDFSKYLWLAAVIPVAEYESVYRPRWPDRPTDENVAMPAALTTVAVPVVEAPTLDDTVTEVLAELVRLPAASRT
jgi:hypothetical protein